MGIASEVTAARRPPIGPVTFCRAAGSPAEGHMSAGLRRVPSFSGRPGFPNGLQVLRAFDACIELLQFTRICGVPSTLACLNRCRCWSSTEMIRAAAVYSRNCRSYPMKVHLGRYPAIDAPWLSMRAIVQQLVLGRRMQPRQLKCPVEGINGLGVLFWICKSCSEAAAGCRSGCMLC